VKIGYSCPVVCNILNNRTIGTSDDGDKWIHEAAVTYGKTFYKKGH
jgi:hypothetical protein